MELQANLAEVQRLGGRVVAASVDSLSVSRSVASEIDLGFPILEDRNHELGSAFGIFKLPGGMDMGPVDSHSIFVIDRTGHVRWKQLAPDTMHVPVDAVLVALKQT